MSLLAAETTAAAGWFLENSWLIPVIPAIAPPAISPLEKSTPGPDSTSASDSPLERFRSTSQRMTPPMNIEAEVEIGR